MAAGDSELIKIVDAALADSVRREWGVAGLPGGVLAVLLWGV